MSTANPYGPPSGPPGQPPGPPPGTAGPTPGPTLDFGRALSFIFKDPDWVSKVLIGSLFSALSMIAIGGIFLAGYVARLLRRSARGEPYPLPEWDDLGGMFVEGLHIIGAYLVHVLPMFVIMMLAMVPAAILGSRGEEPSPAILLVVLPISLLASLGIFAILFYFPSALTRFALEQRFGAAFEVKKNWAFIRRNYGNYMMALVVFLVANFASQLGILAFCIGIFPATFWAMCAIGYALGEVAWRDPANAKS